IAARRECFAIWAECHGPHGAVVSAEGCSFLSAGDLPKHDRLVVTPRGQYLAIRAERHGQHPIVMPLERGLRLTRLYLPKPHRPPAPGSGHVLAIGAEGDCPARACVSFED